MNRPNQSLVVGIVGAIGAGKSTVAARFGEMGARVIDADAVGHEVLGRPAIVEELVGRFGSEILDAGGRIDRRALGRIVFADAQERQRLEAVVHPVMREVFEDRIRRSRGSDPAPLVVLDAALLFEAGWNGLCDRTIFVDAPRTRRLARLQAARGWNGGELARREAAQMPLEAKRARADVVIVNDGSGAEVRRRADRLFFEWTAAESDSRGNQ